MARKQYILAGDIGGTKTRLGLFIRGRKRPLLKVVRTFVSKNYGGIEDLLEDFLKRNSVTVSGACFGIAGPVVDGRCKCTNLPWEVSAARIGRRFAWKRVRLLNDLTAAGLAVPLLTGRELASLNPARGKRGEPIGLVAPGTGLGMALLAFRDGRYEPTASEGGHTDFAPNAPLEAEFWAYLREKYGHVSNERVLSGPGLQSLYAFLRDRGAYREPGWLRKRMLSDDPPQVISEAALAGKSLLCQATLDLFVSILGAVAGNLALTGMTLGGIYLGGGIPPRILPALKSGAFMRSFVDKGRFRGLLERVPVRVILNDKSPLLGSAVCVLEDRSA